MTLARKILLFAGSLVLLLATTTACGSNSDGSGSSGGLQTLKIGSVSPPNSSDYLNVIAEQKGFFAQRGIQPKVLPVPQQPVPPLISGDVDVVTIGVNGLSAVAQHQAVQFVAAEVLPPMVSIVAKKGSSLAAHADQWPLVMHDLSGHTLGTSIASGFNDVMAHALVDDAQAANVKVVPAGSTPAAIAGLQKGAFDAVLLVSPAFESMLASGDYVSILSMYKGVGPDAARLPQSTPMVSARFAKEHPQLISSYQQAIQQANEWARDPANLTELTNMIATKLNQPVTAIADNVKIFVSCLQPSINFTPELWARTLAVAKQTGLINEDYAYEQYVLPMATSRS